MRRRCPPRQDPQITWREIERPFWQRHSPAAGKMRASLQPRLPASPPTRAPLRRSPAPPQRSVKGLESDGLSSPTTNSCDRRRLDVVPVFARAMRWLLATLACVGLGWGGRRPLLEGTAFLAASLSSQLNQLERPNKFQDSFPPSLVHWVLVPPTSIALHDIGLAPGYG